MRLSHRIAPGLVAGTLVLGLSSPAFAAKASHAKVAGRVAAYGQVSGLSGNNFTLTFTPKKSGSTAKTWQVTKGSTTKEIALKGTSGPLANGDYAFVVGTSPSAGTINAASIRYSATAFAGRAAKLGDALGRNIIGVAAAATGQLAAGSTFSLTVSHKDKTTGTTASKTFTFTVTSSTKFKTGAGAPSTTGISLTAGEKILVHYHVNATNKSELDALLVSTVPVGSAKALGRGVVGTAATGGTLSLGGTFQITVSHTNKKTGTTSSKTFTFTVTSDTMFRVGKTAPTSTPLALTAGEKVLVRYKVNPTNSTELDATLVSVAS